MHCINEQETENTRNDNVEISDFIDKGVKSVPCRAGGRFQ